MIAGNPKSDGEQRFRSAGGWVSGAGVLAFVAVVLLVALTNDGVPPWGLALAVAVGAVAWAALISPVVELAPPVLRLRNAFSVVDLPLRSVKDVTVRQFLVVRCTDRRYTCGAVGRSRQQARRGERRAAESQAISYGAFVEVRIRQAADLARLVPEPDAPAEPVRRWRWPEIVVVGGATIATIVLLIL